jgi:succinyl-CoA synthetase beta subunit
VKLLEYQAKNLLKQARVKIPRGRLLNEKSRFEKPVILKAQVATGHRGQNGGVVKVSSTAEFSKTYKSLSDLTISGHKSHNVLAEEILPFKREFYLAILLDRDTNSIRLLARKNGGIDVENSDELPLSIELDNDKIISAAKQLSGRFELGQNYHQKLVKLLNDLLKCFDKNDALLLEINPLIINAKTDELTALDCKMEIDDNAAFCHPDIFAGQNRSANFATLDPGGNVAIVANGAGMAMSTVDQIDDAGLSATNFLDVGGGADADKIATNFAKFTEYKNLCAIVVNIFGGITRCDEVADALIKARAKFPNLPPLLITMAGTNLDEAKKILDDAKLSLLDSLKSAIKKAKELANV